ncbi:MAG: hypothetical protein U1F66_07975 [bacterium]
MIVVVAPYPTKKNERDGYFQRINAVEKSLLDFQRIYLEIAFFGNWMISKEKPSANLEIYRLNYFLHFPYILYLGSKAARIYVHAITNVFKILPLYFFKPIFTDLHGIAPEEARMEGRHLRAVIHSISEYIVVKWSQKVVIVTRRMGSFIQQKYSKFKINFLHIPIFNTLFLSDVPFKDQHKDKPLIIYSGGVHSWQNLEKMVEAAERLIGNFKFLFLVSDVEVMKGKFKNQALLEKVEVKSVSRNEISHYYEKADFGFLLREDNPVNQVACPTKIIEYVSFGIIPILLQPKIGDFQELGLKFILLDDLYNNPEVSRFNLDQMREQNLNILYKMKQECEEGLNLLREQIAQT